MKTKRKLSGIMIAALCGTLQAIAQPATSENPSPERDRLREGQYRLGKLEKADKIIGMEIKDARDEKLGAVKDLAIDLQNGRIVEVIVGTGGLLGVDERFVAVPPERFTCDTARHTLQLNADNAQFKAAPTFKMSVWEANVQEASVAGVYQYFGANPYFNAERQNDRNGNGGTTAFGKVWRATKLLGTTTRNLKNEKVGKVENLIVDLPAGRVVDVILASGGFLGLGDELSALPPQSFHAGSEPHTLAVDTTKEALSQSPHFKSSEWPDLNNPEHVTTVYRAYHVDPYFTTNAVDNSAQNVRDRADSALTPLRQGSSAADVDTTRQIRRLIIADKDLSVNAHNVKVITVDGRVTLRGPVNSAEEKRQIADLAARVTAAASVDNQLQVPDTATTNSK